MMRTTIGVVFAAAFTISGAAQDFIAQSGVPEDPTSLAGNNIGEVHEL
jgi:hypothetical protein